MLYRTPCQLCLTPYPPLPIVYQIPVYGIMTPCTHGISKALPMLYRLHCLWYFHPTTQVMINHLPMLYQAICLWYFDPTHGILTLLSMVHRSHSS